MINALFRPAICTYTGGERSNRAQCTIHNHCSKKVEPSDRGIFRSFILSFLEQLSAEQPRRVVQETFSPGSVLTVFIHLKHAYKLRGANSSDDLDRRCTVCVIRRITQLLVDSATGCIDSRPSLPIISQQPAVFYKSPIAFTTPD